MHMSHEEEGDRTGAVEVGTEKRDHGFFVYVKPGQAQQERGWSTVEIGPYETEEAANENVEKITKAFASIPPPPKTAEE